MQSILDAVLGPDARTDEERAADHAAAETRRAAHASRFVAEERGRYAASLRTAPDGTLYRALRMAGTCRNGFERDGGRLHHAVPADPLPAEGRPTSGAGWERALCGARPGARGNGWSDHPGDAVTCPRCLSRLP